MYFLPLIAAFTRIKGIRHGLHNLQNEDMFFGAVCKGSSLPISLCGVNIAKLEADTTGAVGVIRPLTLAGVVLSLLEALLPWFIFASSEAEYATAAFVDEGNDDGRLALTPFPGGENKCASTSTDEEDEKVLSSSEEVDWR